MKKYLFSFLVSLIIAMIGLGLNQALFAQATKIITPVENHTQFSPITDTVNTIYFINNLDSLHVCKGVSPGLINGTDLGTIFTYQWEKSTDNITFHVLPGDTNKTFSTGPIDSTTYYRRVATDTSGLIKTSNKVKAIVDPASVGGTLSATTQQICQNGSVSFSLSGSVGSVSWQEKVSPSSIWQTIHTGNINLNYSFPDTGIISIRAYVKSDSCPPASSNVITVRVHPVLVKDIIIGDTAVCNDQSAIYSVPLDTLLQYSWHISLSSGVFQGDSTSNKVTVLWAHTDNIKHAILSVEKQYSQSSCKITDSIVVSVYPIIAPSDSLLRKRTIDTTELFLMDSKYNSDTLTYTYTWGSKRGTSDSINAKYNDKYFCIFNNYNAQDSIKYYVEIGRKGNPKCLTRTYFIPPPAAILSYPLKVFPNPNNGAFKFLLEGTNSGAVEISVYSITGTLVASMNCNKTLYRQLFSASFSQLAPGIYLLKAIYPGGETAFQKLSVY